MSLRPTRAQVALCLAALLAAAACPKRVATREELDPDSRRRVDQAEAQAKAGNSSKARDMLDELPRDAQENEAVAEVLFKAAETDFAKRRWAEARDAYLELLERFPSYRYADASRYHLGLSQVELGEHAKGLQTLAPLVRRLPERERPRAAEALVRAAEEEKNVGAALEWHLYRASLAPDDRALQERTRRGVEDTLDRAPFNEVAKLAEETSPESLAWPAIQMKLARVLLHLRDRSRAAEALEELLRRAPHSIYAAEATALLAQSQVSSSGVQAKTLGLLAPMSGKNQLYGKTILSAVQLALEGSSVQLVVRDSAADPAAPRRMAAELIEKEHVLGIIGPVLGEETESAASEADSQETPIVTLSFAEGLSEIGPYVFRHMLTHRAQAEALADYAVLRRGKKKLGILYPSIPYGTELMTAFKAAVEARGGEVKGVESYPSDTTTYGPILRKLIPRASGVGGDAYLERRREIMESIKDPYRQKKALEEAKKRASAPVVTFDALFIPDFYRNIGLIAPALAVEDVITNICDPDDLRRISATIGRQARTVQLLGANGWNYNELVERGGKFVQCAVFVDGFFARSERPATRAFTEAWAAANNGKDPSLLAASAYDTAKLLRHIIETKAPTSRDALLEALRAKENFAGATGDFHFDERGEVQKPLFFLTIGKEGIEELKLDDPAM